MAPDDNSGGRPAGPVVLRIKLRYDDLDAMVQRFAPNVGKAGLFLPTRSIQPVGTEVKFELRLANDAPVLVGLGRVKRVKPPDPANPRAAFGMAIELMRVSRDGREVIIRMIERRRAMGLADVSIPMPDDAESARRAEVETQPRGETSGVVRDAMAQLASAEPEEGLLGAKPASGPIAVAKSAVASPASETAAAVPTSEPAAQSTNESAVTQPASEPARSSSPLLTSPRAGTGSIARDDRSGRIAVPVLAPEKSRPRRPRVEELIDRAAELSARVVVVDDPDLDMHVDVDRVLTRARALAGGDMDVELAALREAAAAPVEISVEAASAELARQLGGKPIAKRERSARWETPPPVVLRHPLPEPGEPVVVPRVEPEPARDVAEESPPGEEFSARTRAETEGDPAATIAAVVTAAVQAQAPAVPVTADTEVDDGTEEFERDDRTQTPTSETVASAFAASSGAAPENDRDTERPSRRLFGPADDVTTDPASDSRLLIDDNADASALERALEGADDDEPDMLASGEYEIAEDTRYESTQIGGPVGASYPEPDQLAAQLDQQLAEAEAEAEREVAEGLAGDAVYGEPDEQEISELDVLAEADEDDEELLAAQGYPAQPSYAAEPAYAEQPYSAEPAYAEQPYSAEPAYAEQPYSAEPAYAEQPYAAERSYADEPYAAERSYAPESTYAQPPYAPEAASDDFASRLDLGDDELPPDDEFDHEAAREFDREAAAELDLQAARELLASAPAAIDDDPYRHAPMRERSRRPSSEPSSSYTFAEDFPNAGLQP
ncbi:MAG TPA: hypothetical protein VFS15_11915, partial [Kofleriaceae bacterium]|nr:hypothetical protein [Kofleriaceae bacterium]